jgi:hypothetical protein
MLLLPPSTTALRHDKKFQFLKKYEGRVIETHYTSYEVDNHVQLIIDEFCIDVTGCLVVITKEKPNSWCLEDLKRFLLYFDYNTYVVWYKGQTHYRVIKGTFYLSLYMPFPEKVVARVISNEIVDVRPLSMPRGQVAYLNCYVGGIDPVHQNQYERALHINTSITTLIDNLHSYNLPPSQEQK